MADNSAALTSLLAALTGGAQRSGGQATPLPSGFAGLPLSAAQQGAPAPVNSPPGGFALPQPSASGSLDLSAIKPSASGKVSLEDAIAKAKAKATDLGVQPSYRGRALVEKVTVLARELSAYTSDTAETRYDESRSRDRYRRSRSRSRSPRRGGYGDGFRDERRGRNEYRDRSYSPTRRGFSPSARVSGGGGRLGGGSQRGSAKTGSPSPEMESITIDASLVGLIIGRGGENLRRVEAETGARVQFMTNGHDRDSGGERVCNIQGNRQQIAATRRAIELIIAENDSAHANKSQPAARGSNNNQRNAPSAPVMGGQPQLRDGEDSIQIFVPDRTVGLIIGRGGETIRDIQEKSACHVNIVGEGKSVNGQRPVNLIGSTTAADHAKRLIMEIVDSDTHGGPPGPGVTTTPVGSGRAPIPERNNDFYGGGGGGGGSGGNPAGKQTETMKVPIDAVGMIIGKGGETIKEMQASTGCRINVSSQFNPSDAEREISIAGSRDAILRARAIIEDKVEAAQAKQRGGGGGGGRNNNNNSNGYDNNSNNSSSRGFSNSSQSATGDAADPYAPYGGYEAYCKLYWTMMAQQGAAGGQAPPGTT